MNSFNGPRPSTFVEIGQRFGSLTVISTDARVGVTPEKPWGFRAAVCRCDCGNETTAKISALIHGRRKSCGPRCDYSPPKMSARTQEGRARAANLVASLSPEQEAKRRTKSTGHGFASRGRAHPLYSIWTGMIDRCENPAAPNYARYGGRGITVHPPWRDLATFIADIESEIGPRPEEYIPGKKRKVYRHSLDRVDNNSGYRPGNVRWATGIEQQANTGRPGPSKCSVDDCDRTAKSLGMCNMHYVRQRKASRPKPPPKPRPQRAECSEDGCTELNYGRGLCRRHYKAWWWRNRRKAEWREAA